ncbi:two-component response regulator 24-like [Diospyros lotus]|uniref:two-component response regulator 24-like n=1 Tax=Diospyros lotus TaxID=55363 RepID=UPI00224FDA3C|nr:two-component response regulator 24-like [Diospyros lotus]
MASGAGGSDSVIANKNGDEKNTDVATGRKFYVLVVDDDRATQMIHSMMFKRYGLETQVAGNGKEAVELYRSGASFHLVLMDLEMPVMDGCEATRELRAMGVTSMIVGVTSADLDSVKEAFVSAGLDGCYGKPLTVDNVKSSLQELDNKKF